MTRNQKRATLRNIRNRKTDAQTHYHLTLLALRSICLAIEQSNDDDTVHLATALLPSTERAYNDARDALIAEHDALDMRVDAARVASIDDDMSIRLDALKPRSREMENAIAREIWERYVEPRTGRTFNS